MTTDIQRTPWPSDFPDVVVHMDLKARNRHPAYAAGKSGDAMAAYAFVTDVLNENSFKLVAALIAGRKPLLAPVAAIERETVLTRYPMQWRNASRKIWAFAWRIMIFASPIMSDIPEPMAGFD